VLSHLEIPFAFASPAATSIAGNGDSRTHTTQPSGGAAITT
jgi:hypothetical protein